MLERMTILDHLFRIRNYGLQDIFDHEALIKAIRLLKDNPQARQFISYSSNPSTHTFGGKLCSHENGYYHTLKFGKWLMIFEKRFFCCSDCGKLVDVRGRKY